MVSEKKLQAVYCEDDGEYTVYCNICDNLCIERFNKNHLKSQTRNNIIRKIQQLKIFLFHIKIVQLNMEYYCQCCDKTNKIKSENILFRALAHIQYEKSFRINDTIKSPDFFDIDELFRNYIIKHNKKSDSYLVKSDFKLIFNILTPHIKTDFYHNISFINLKKFLIYWIEHFLLRGCKFSHINEMNISTINDEKNMTYEHYIKLKQPMQAIKLKINMIIAINPHLINSFNRYKNHPSIRKISHIPLNN